MITAVVFDMDGLMFDTEKLCIKAWDYVGEVFVKKPLGHLVYKALGLSWSASKQILFDEIGPVDFESFRMESRMFTRRYITEHGMPIKPGLFELLEYLQQNKYKIAVASSSSENSVRSYLKIAQVEKYFSAVICGDMIEKSKPEPDIFLEACRCLGETPKKCLVLEDSRNGILAGVAAGCPTIMIPDIWPGDSQTDQRLAAKLASLNDVIGWLQKNR